MKSQCYALIGLPASGKSTLGRMLASQLSLRFFDTDQLIEEKTGKSIPELFKERGEIYFRNLESGLLDELISNPEAKLIATGGGLPVFNNQMSRLLQFFTVIYLEIAKEPWLSRMQVQKLSLDRPLLASVLNQSLEDIYDKLLNDRAETYGKAQIRIPINSNEKPDITLLRIMDLLS